MMMTSPDFDSRHIAAAVVVVVVVTVVGSHYPSPASASIASAALPEGPASAAKPGYLPFGSYPSHHTPPRTPSRQPAHRLGY